MKREPIIASNPRKTMTEDEAKTKACPHARHFDPGNGDSPNCCASGCMAWRWSEAKRTAAFLEAVQTHMQGQPKPNFNTALQAVYAETGGQFERVEGFCGLAGQAA